MQQHTVQKKSMNSIQIICSILHNIKINKRGIWDRLKHKKTLSTVTHCKYISTYFNATNFQTDLFTGICPSTKLHNIGGWQVSLFIQSSAAHLCMHGSSNVVEHWISHLWGHGFKPQLIKLAIKLYAQNSVCLQSLWMKIFIYFIFSDLCFLTWILRHLNRLYWNKCFTKVVSFLINKKSLGRTQVL